MAQLKRHRGIGDNLFRRSFPRARARGPIEAVVNDCEGSDNNDFPRARARGPIEAKTHTAMSRARATAFHARERVAQLKLRQLKTCTQDK